MRSREQAFSGRADSPKVVRRQAAAWRGLSLQPLYWFDNTNTCNTMDISSPSRISGANFVLNKTCSNNFAFAYVLHFEIACHRNRIFS